MTAQADCPGADAAALDWLDRMSRSAQELSYAGVATLQRGDEVETVQVAHRIAEGSSDERLELLTGLGTVVVRNGHPLDCVHPGQRLLRLGEMRAAAAAPVADEPHARKVNDAERCGIARYYRIVIDGEHRVAGRKSVQLRIQPADMYRFGYVMAVDSETGLLLKVETLDSGERVLERFQFAQLSYDDAAPLPSGAASTLQIAGHTKPTHAEGSPVGRAWRINWLPQGFRPTDTAAGGSARRSYTDGLAAFSVFLEHLDHDIRPGEGQVRNGSTTSYTRGMQLAGQPVLVTVIGEVPVNTARMVADSVQWEP